VQDDLPCIEAKKISPGLIVGVSTHSMHEALMAKADGADYINITKTN
jgi:thiamine-phosphate pyrophosphorylase